MNTNSYKFNINMNAIQDFRVLDKKISSKVTGIRDDCKEPTKLLKILLKIIRNFYSPGQILL
jgi:hypothetical protein